MADYRIAYTLLGKREIEIREFPALHLIHMGENTPCGVTLLTLHATVQALQPTHLERSISIPYLVILCHSTLRLRNLDCEVRIPADTPWFVFVLIPVDMILVEWQFS